MIFNLFRRKKRVHLRYVLQVGVLIEEEGERFYREFAQRAVDTRLKELCVQLANEEVGHKKLFEGELAQWIKLPIDREYLQAYIQELKGRGLFSDPFSFYSSVDDLLKYFIRYENITADFYQSLEKEFPELQKQLYMRQLSLAERGHADRLKALIK